MRLKLSYKELIFPILILISFLVWKPIIIFIFPGILIFYIKDFKKIGLSEIIVYMISISLSFWICVFWILKFVKIPFTILFYVVSAACFGYVFYFSYFKKNPNIKINYREIIIIALFIIVLLLYTSIMRNQIVAAGADMSMHTYIARLIYEENGFPLSYKPILPINHFGVYNTGFQSISALISLIGNLPIYRSTLLMTGFTYFFFSICLYVFLRRFYNKWVSLVASLIISFAGSQPMGYIGWGGNPTILSLSFVILGLSLIYLFKEKSKFAIFIISLVLCSAFLTNSAPLLIFSYIYIGIFLFDLIKSKLRKGFIIKHVLIVLVSLLILSPFILNLRFDIISKNERDWVIELNQNHITAWHGNLKNSIVTIPMNVKRYDGKFISLLAFIGFFCMLFINKSEAFKYLIVTAILFVLILNSHYHILPFSYILFSHRIATIALIPFAIFIGSLINFISRTAVINLKKKEIAKKILGVCALVFLFLVLTGFIQNSISRYSFFIKSSQTNSMVTLNDIEAYKWIEENTKTTDLFLNNYGDGGAWIPAIAFRPITNPHNTHPYFDEFREGIKRLKPKYVYIGQKKVYKIDLYKEEFDAKPDEYEPVFSKGNVKIYKINLQYI